MLDNAGQTITLTNPWRVSATIRGGTIAGPARLIAGYPYTQGMATLDDVTLATDLEVQAGGLYVPGSLTLSNSTLRLVNGPHSGPQINFSAPTFPSPPRSINGTGTISFEGSDPQAAHVLTGDALTIGPGITVRTLTTPAQITGNLTLQGTAEARNGYALTFSSPANLLNGTLAGGTWAAYDSTLSIGPSNSPITTNNATLLLSGPTASIPSLSSLRHNNGSLTLTAGKELSFNASPFTNTGTITIGPASSLRFHAPLTNTGTIDLHPSATLTLYSATPAAIRTQLATARITSTTPDPADLHSLAYLPSGPSTLVQLTLTGDANLDGRLNQDDYALLDRGLATSGQFWSDGDFNYDGQVDQNDYLLLDRTYLLTKAQGWQSLGSSFLPMRASQFGPAYVSQLLTSIPEPASPLACLFATSLLTRRRRVE